MNEKDFTLIKMLKAIGLMNAVLMLVSTLFIMGLDITRGGTHRMQAGQMEKLIS